MWTEKKNARRLELLDTPDLDDDEALELDGLQTLCEDYNHRKFERTRKISTSLDDPREYPLSEATRLYMGLKMLGGENY